MKRFFVKVRSTNKFIMAVLGLFLAIVGVLAVFKTWGNKNISGAWHLKFKNNKSTLSTYVGEIHSQKVFFIQNDCSVSGDGEKTEYNGHPLPSHQHRKLEYQGTVDGAKLIAKYVLHGERRVSEGSMIVEISDDEKTLTGTFIGTAGNTEGEVVGERID